jgi:arylsulfatase A-like enzyme
MVGSHRLISKNIFYEASAKTMTLIKQPHKIAPSRASDALINTADIMPTMLDLCGVAVPEGLDGSSFKPLCYGEAQAGFDELFAVNSTGRMLRFGRYKYVRSELYGESFEILFDLAVDPDESTNLFGADGYETISADARQRMRDWLRREQLAVTFDPI